MTNSIFTAGYPFVVYPEDSSRIRFDGRGPNRTPNRDDLANLMGAKALRTALVHYHHEVDDVDVLIVRGLVKFVEPPSLPDVPSKHWGMLVKIIYRFTSRPKSEFYIHVFHFVSDDRGGLSGRFFTQFRRHVTR